MLNTRVTLPDNSDITKSVDVCGELKQSKKKLFVIITYWNFMTFIVN